MSSRERLIFTTRPGGTPLWLPSIMAEFIGITEGSRLTDAQFNNDEIQSLISRRITAEKTKKPKQETP